jgi:exodeoxyribonuclease-3
MKIATWNVNSIKMRRDLVARWLGEEQPDIVCLQEIKCLDEAFPSGVFEELGYNVAVHGQKTYNGVAILSKYPIDDVARGLPGDEDDDQARYIEAVISLKGSAMRVASIYLPNGNPIGGPKFDYKLSWFARLHTHAQALLAQEEMLVLGGDYNVIPQREDVHDPAAWTDDALFQPESRACWRRLLHLGLSDSLRTSTDESGLYSFWDYQGGAWQKNSGIRIDHLLLSPQAADRLIGAAIDKRPRAWDKPSDHVPVWAELRV